MKIILPEITGISVKINFIRLYFLVTCKSTHGPSMLFDKVYLYLMCIGRFTIKENIQLGTSVSQVPIFYENSPDCGTSLSL